MIILMMGPQGSGKGTQGEKISDYLHLPLITAGHLLRIIPETDPNYAEVHKSMDAGKLIPTSLMAQIIKERVSQDDCANGYVLDGWARSMKQFDFFFPKFDKVIYLDIPKQMSIDRLSSRRSCPNCGDVYNLMFIPPKVEGVCDRCGTKLVQRKDDIPEAISTRLEIFYNETKEVLDYFEKKGILIKVDATPLPDVIFEDIKKKLDS